MSYKDRLIDTLIMYNSGYIYETLTVLAISTLEYFYVMQLRGTKVVHRYKQS